MSISVYGSVSGVQGSGLLVQNLEIGDQGSGFRVCGLRFRIEGFYMRGDDFGLIDYD